MKIRNLSKSDLHVCYSAQFAKSLIKKGFGLIILNNFENFDGLFFENCKIIHSFFMKHSFDVIFLDSEYKVIAMYSDFKPFKISKFYGKAKYVLELPKGKIIETKIDLFDKFKVYDL